MKSKIAVINGKYFDGNIFRKGNILINGKKIVKISEDSKYKLADLVAENYEIIDARNSLISYGFFDPHVHFRCPGADHKEDWVSGVNAAISGGYTYVSDMPNNSPAATQYDILRIKSKYPKKIPINFGLYLGLTDENSSDLKKIIKKIKKNKIPFLGIKCYLGSTTGGLLVKNYASVRNALATKEPVLFHCEDEAIIAKYKDIVYNGIKDHNAKRPPLAELSGFKKIIRTAINIRYKAKIYICHISSKILMKEIAKRKREGFNVIGEVTPHHLFFHLSNVENSNLYKVNPPIREVEDVDYLRKAFNKGYFDLVGTDHAPHLLSEKNSNAPPSGFPGLETAFYALYNLYERKILNLGMIFKMLTNGYKVFNIKKRGEIKKGYYADLTIIRKELNTFDEKNAHTKADFSPWNGLQTGVKIESVLLNGKLVYNDGKLLY